MRYLPSLRHYAQVILVCCGLGVLVFIFLYRSESPSPSVLLQDQGDDFEVKRLLLALFIANLCGILVYTSDRLLDLKLRWQQNFMLRFVSGLSLNTLIIVMLIRSAAHSFFNPLTDEAARTTILFVIFLFIYEIIYGLFYSYRYYAHTQVEQIQSERWQLELQFESLKTQISPHYLFNCLNTISSLLYKDTHMAEEFIRRMADSFRYVLSHQKQKLVSLREEIEFVKSYYYLLQVRYEQHLKLELNIPKIILDSQVPPLAIQMLVENAVKHNQISKDFPLFIYISALDDRFILVTSSKTLAVKGPESFRIGLDNIRHRYRFFTMEKIRVKDEEQFTVQLPVIKYGIKAHVMTPKAVS